jgi:hypothetical protein
MHEAARNGHVSCLEALLDAGAETSHPNQVRRPRRCAMQASSRQLTPADAHHARSADTPLFTTRRTAGTAAPLLLSSTPALTWRRACTSAAGRRSTSLRRGARRLRLQRWFVLGQTRWDAQMTV